MSGWEYPPRFAGGLGKACQGLSQGLANQGAQVFFVLPTFPERVSERHLEVVGALECLVEAGWTAEMAQSPPVEGAQTKNPSPQATRSDAGITYYQADAHLFPYGGAPQGKISQN